MPNLAEPGAKWGELQNLISSVAIRNIPLFQGPRIAWSFSYIAVTDYHSGLSCLQWHDEWFANFRQKKADSRKYRHHTDENIKQNVVVTSCKNHIWTRRMLIFCIWESIYLFVTTCKLFYVGWFIQGKKKPTH